jgi:hypothetical protein
MSGVWLALMLLFTVGSVVILSPEPSLRFG